MQIFTETGRLIFGPDIDTRLTETGRRCVRRPVTETGRRQLGVYYVVIKEDMTATLHLDFDPTFEVEITTCQQNWDLRTMMPQKFQDATVMMDYLKAVSRVVNGMVCRIDALGNLVGLQTCPKKYLGHLAALVAYKIKNQRYATTAEIRKQIELAVDMYKIKGTYNVLKLAFYMIGLDVTIWDLWTIDYQNFTRYVPHFHSGITGGFVSDSSIRSDDGWFFDENKRMDGGGGFKSPHFDLVVEMTRPYYYNGAEYKLFVEDMWPAIEEIIEEFTPVNTVPNFYLGLYCFCKEDYLSYEIPTSEVKTCITDSWDPATYYFDAGHETDHGKVMDWSFDSMIQGITVFKIGTGNRNRAPNSAMTDLENIQYTGTVDSYQVTNDKITFKMKVPIGVEIADVSELGLYHAGTGDLMVVSLFPAFDKPNDTVVEITVEVQRKL